MPLMEERWDEARKLHLTIFPDNPSQARTSVGDSIQVGGVTQMVVNKSYRAPAPCQALLQAGLRHP